MKILIVDDELPARSRLRSMLSSMTAYEVVAEAGNGYEALQAIQKHEPDVVLLDIRMPGMDGLETAEHLGKLETRPAIIFTTAYNDYALPAFKTHAVDYLLKPVRKEHLQQALEATRQLNRAQLQALGDIKNTASEPSHISARFKGEIRLIPVEEILYFQAEHKYVTVCHHQGEDLIEEPLTRLEEKFPHSFMRIHRNALVAVTQIAALEKTAEGHCRIRLKHNDKTLEVSRRHLPHVRKFMKK